jgi:hypothetical protein
VDGAFTAETISDDLSLFGVNGDIRADVGDSARLRLNPAPGQTYTVEAGGDIVCRVPAESSARFDLTCGGEIRIRKLDAPDQRAREAYAFTLGEGDAEVTLSAGGDIALSSRSAVWETDPTFGADFAAEMGLRMGELADQLTSQIQVQMEAATRQMDETLAGMANNEEFASRVQAKVQQAMRTAEAKFEEAMRNTERRMQEAERRAAEREARRRREPSWGRAAKASPKQPKRTPVREEERMAILRMVEEGKISVEQAEQLLAALQS